MLVFEMLKTPEEPDKWKAVEDKVGIKTVTEEDTGNACKGRL